MLYFLWASSNHEPQCNSQHFDSNEILDTKEQQAISNQNQLNLDQDAFGDICDDDDDGDEVDDNNDNCPRVSNPNQVNSDNDAFGDAFE